MTGRWYTHPHLWGQMEDLPAGIFPPEAERNAAAVRVRSRRRIRRTLGIPVPAGVPLAQLVVACQAMEILGWEEGT